MVAAQWVGAGLLVGGDGHETSPFVRAAVHAAKTSLVRSHAVIEYARRLCARHMPQHIWGHTADAFGCSRRRFHACCAPMLQVISAAQLLSVGPLPASLFTFGPKHHPKPRGTVPE